MSLTKDVSGFHQVTGRLRFENYFQSKGTLTIRLSFLLTSKRFGSVPLSNESYFWCTLLTVSLSLRRDYCGKHEDLGRQGLTFNT